MKKPIIIAIVGESGCGKTSLSFYLQDKVNIPAIVSYTTRPMRENEKNGKEHYFVSESAMPPKHEMLAYTFFGGHHYWTLRSQVEEQRIVSYVIDEKGLIELENKYVDDFDLLKVLVMRPNNPTNQSRLDRDKERVAYSDYQCVLVNNGTLTDFYKNAIITLGEEIALRLQ